MPAKFLQVGDLCHPKLWSQLFLVQAGTGTAGTCNVLTKKLSLCKLFLSVCQYILFQLYFMVSRSNIKVLFPVTREKHQFIVPFIDAFIR